MKYVAGFEERPLQNANTPVSELDSITLRINKVVLSGIKQTCVNRVVHFGAVQKQAAHIFILQMIQWHIVKEL